MSDTSYNVFQHYGTAAQRAAFTPSPAVGTQPIYIWYESDNPDDFYIYTTAWKGPYQTGGGSAPAGSSVQVVNTQTGAVNTGTTVLPFDDTIPQNTEGNEFMTLAITPTSITNKLIIEVVLAMSISAAPDNASVALFQDSTAGALAAAYQFIGTATAGAIVSFRHYMTAGTTSATTFKVRAGMNGAGTVTFNGQSGARRFGGVMASSITITEIKV